MRYLILIFLFSFLIFCERDVSCLIDLDKATFELPYNRHYDHDTSFKLVGEVSKKGVLKVLEIYTLNFSHDVDFNIVLRNKTDNPYIENILYKSPKMTSTVEKVSLKLDDIPFDDLVVNIFRYETYKPIDFVCVISYIN